MARKRTPVGAAGLSRSRVRPDSSIRESTDAKRTEHQWSGSKVDRAGLRCYQRDGTWKSLNLNRIKASQYRDSWTALPMATIRRNTGLDMFYPGRNVTQARPPRRTRTQECKNSEPQGYGYCCRLITLVLRSVRRVSTCPIALVPPQSAVTHDT